MKKEPIAPKPKPLIASLSVSSEPSLISHLGLASILGTNGQSNATHHASIRQETFKLIQSWLSGFQSQLSDDEMMRIWKWLLYCLGHSNKPSAQVQLISRISSLLLILNPLLSLQYFSLFLVTVRRHGIGHLRLDMLIRKFVNGMFCLMMKCKWDFDYLGKFIYALEKNALLVEDKVRGSSVNYLIVSVFLDELKEFTVPLETKEVVKCLFRPFLGVLERSSDKVLVGKVKSCVFDVLLKMGKKLLEREMNGIEDVVGGNGERLLGIIALKMGFCAMLHEVASSINCIQANNEVVLELHEEFLVLEKELETSGIDIHMPEVHVSHYDVLEIPELVPFEFGEGTKLGLIQDSTEEGILQKKKRKTGELRDKKTVNKKTMKDVANSDCPANGNAVIDNNLETVKSCEKRVKRVLFDMKNNLIWMTHTPLPPQNLRLPPSAIPRGSALRKGVPPGPVREVTTSLEKVVALKKGRKMAKIISPAPKRLKRVEQMNDWDSEDYGSYC